MGDQEGGLPHRSRERHLARAGPSFGQSPKTAASICTLKNPDLQLLQKKSGTAKGVITNGVFSPVESLESLKSLNSLESLESGRIRLCFPQSGGPLESLESRKSLESLGNRLF